MSIFSTILFAYPSFWEGWSRLADFGDTMTEFNLSPSGASADYYAMMADWRAVGEDFQTVIRGYAPAGQQ